MKQLTIVLCLLVALCLAPRADSAGEYNPDLTVSTQLLAGPGTLQVMVRDNKTGQNSGWVDAVSNPSGDGRDVLKTGSFTCGGKVYKWKNGKLYRATGNGWGLCRKKPAKKKGTTQRNPQGWAFSAAGDEVVSLPDN